MAQEIQAGVSFQWSTRSLAPSAGLSSLQELFQRRVQLYFEAAPDQPVDARMTVQGLPGVRRAKMVSNLDASLVRGRPMLSDGEDDVCLIVKTGGHLFIDQRGQQSVARTGDAVLLVYREPATLRFLAMNYVALRVPFAALAPLTTKIEALAAGCIRRENAALQLLGTYLGSLPGRIADPRLCSVISTHIYDLMALAIGATRDGRELATQRGLRAARLEAIKADLTRDTGLTLDDVAHRQGVSPRYVQKLFEESGTTFTAFLLERRLEAARSMLLSPRYAHCSVAAIAMEASFGDLSYFNRRFKARYGQTPTDMRAQGVSGS